MGAEELMAAADRAMYQAKKLGKNQISGNPRPRPALLARRSAADEEAPAPVEAPAPKAPETARSGMSGPSEDRAVAVELGPIAPPVMPPAPAVPEPRTPDDSEPNPQDVRRHIATASRSFDPDHQIRRAMDAFLSPGIVERERDRERPTPDH